MTIATARAIVAELSRDHEDGVTIAATLRARGASPAIIHRALSGR